MRRRSMSFGKPFVPSLLLSNFIDVLAESRPFDKRSTLQTPFLFSARVFRITAAPLEQNGAFRNCQKLSYDLRAYSAKAYGMLLCT